MTKIRISSKCIETFICVHTVWLNGKKTEMNGKQIEKLLRKNGDEGTKRYAHFAKYRSM